MAAFQLIEEDLICARPVPKSVNFLCNHVKQIFEAGYEEQRATGEKKKSGQRVKRGVHLNTSYLLFFKFQHKKLQRRRHTFGMPNHSKKPKKKTKQKINNADE